MAKESEVTRREFLKGGTTGAGFAALGGINFITNPDRVFGANDRIRFAMIGCGDRAQEDLHAALKSPNVECVAGADVYTRRLDKLKKIVPTAKTFQDFRKLLDDKTIDAVVIATPQHQHALNFVPAIQAGKDVYQEKTMAFNPDHARRMQRAFKDSDRIVQVGIQSTSSDAFCKVRDMAAEKDKMGDITGIHTHMWRNARYGGWKRDIPADCDLAHVDWKMFQGESARRGFDANRVINWRFFWDYAGGNVFENMVHQVGFWFKALNLQPPTAVTMSGANYLSPGMEVPDTMDVSMEMPEKILFTWNSGFGNRHYKAEDDFLLGTKGTIIRGRFHAEYVAEGQHQPSAPGMRPSAPGGPAESMVPDIVGRGDSTPAHFANFFECMRTRKEPNCPFDLGFNSAIACQMAVRSYRERRRVVWDAEHEEIV